MGRPRKVPLEESELDEMLEEVEEDAELTMTPKQSLEAQLAFLQDLRNQMVAMGVDSIGKCDVLMGQLNAEISKL